MRIITLNCNGIRSAWAKGLPAWLARQKADIVCLQEVKAQESDCALLRAPKGFESHFHCGDKRGYSGVALYSRHRPDAVSCGFGSKEFDPEGRLVRADYGRLSVVSVYLPSGSSGPERQQAKFRFLDEFYPYLKKLRREGREYILCGDWNIAHKPIDLKNWRSNQKNSGFLPEERAWLSKVFDELGWVDVFRRIDPRPDQYTWWSNRGQAWAKNVGWRIDYQIATPGIAAKAGRVSIYKAKRFSDHAPLTVEYDHGL
ncbi:MAG: exodeoxyribonuclease III [Betaproteobacteria bacterium RBG_16_64_9]|nr:MAG: exodeoxyribonuclease III [Betaproteobacteria bacterium RBG_16_64_9]OGA29860.1 MAG: exodeoxyribonuclease III [Betaproteobacteria bacterium RIFCSPLOWO2_02_FULL_65_24]OGA77643.1 MAG: exodeoxyribonuclease III [Betaproteobacteria bacterium RIFCSPLOWO2_12_FULL_66_14]